MRTDSQEDLADYKRLNNHVFGKESGSNARRMALFRSHWQEHISKLLCFPAYQDEFTISAWDCFMGCRLREVSGPHIPILSFLL